KNASGSISLVGWVQATRSTAPAYPLSSRSDCLNKGFPSIAYQVTVDHTRRTLAVTAGFARATNDKTIVHYDPSVDRMKTYEAYTQMDYTLVDSEQREFTEKGGYLNVNGGCRQWRCLMCPLKSVLQVAELKWSKRLEGVR
ncbi:unnamed protein product, partial [Discosporangium mesarthrocarpum]